MKQNKKQNIRRSNLLEILATLLVIVFVNIIGNYLFTRFDLTAEKRFTLSEPTKKTLKGLDDQLFFRVYLEGDDLSPQYRRFRNEIKDMLDQFRAYNRHVEYEFFDPSSLKTDEEKMQFYQELRKNGITPLLDQDDEGSVMTQQVVVPAMMVSYNGRETAQQLQVADLMDRSEAINVSIENLEYNFVRAIHRLTHPVKSRVGFMLGHGELKEIDLFDIQMSLVDDYSLENVILDEHIGTLTGHVMNTQDSSVSIANKYDVLVVPKPLQPFSDRDLFILDQYMMYGGKILWLVDALDADMDSLQGQPQTFATRLSTNLDEFFFNYGVRVNPDLIMDYRCRGIPMMSADNRMQLVPWYYFPTLVPHSNHPIVSNLDVLKTDFVSSIDLINNDIKKTVLLSTSDHVHIKNAPVNIQLADAMVQVNDQLFNKKDLPVAVLLEGKFKSLFRSRLTADFAAMSEIGYKTQCDDTTQMIVVSDGDMIRNDVGMSEQGMFPYPLGYDCHINTKFANKKFLLNAIYYLAGDEDLIYAASRHISIRQLDKNKVETRRGYYQFATLTYPVLMVLAVAAAVLVSRRLKYRRKKNA